MLCFPLFSLVGYLLLLPVRRPTHTLTEVELHQMVVLSWAAVGLPSRCGGGLLGVGLINALIALFGKRLKRTIPKG